MNLQTEKRKINLPKNQNNLISLRFLSYILAVGIFSWGILFFSGVVTLGGLPSSVVVKFMTDPPALTAFFAGNNKGLHARLEKIGIEEDIKEYYRPQIPDEIELDRYIHQLFYNLSGYVGYNYNLDENRKLVLKESGEYRIQEELRNKANKTNIPSTYLSIE